MRKPYPTDLSDSEWEFIRKDFENNNPRGRPPKHEHREIVQVLNGAYYPVDFLHGKPCTPI